MDRNLLQRRRFTTVLIIVPCVLSIVTVIATLVLPSSSFQDFILRFTGSNNNYEDDQLTVMFNDEISNPNEDNSATMTDAGIAGDPNKQTTKTKASDAMVPKELADLGVYDEASDFVNEQGIVPTGWEYPNDDPLVWGPCRFDRPVTLEWTDRRRRPPSKINTNTSASASNSPDYYRNADTLDFDYLGSPLPSKPLDPQSGWCRPGFLIIGAGKCGTSSLYHYLIGHPRVVPAYEKQIHYFKYRDSSKPLAWYYGHFPTPQSFLEHGALMTGEASPGYLPYPGVAKNAYKAWKGTLSGNGAGLGSMGKPLTTFLASPSHKSVVPKVPPRIIALGREPFDRIQSSYKYNYVVPTIKHLRKIGHPNIPTAKKKKKYRNGDDGDNKNGFQLNREDDEYYLPYLFTLEDFIRAELQQLRGCLYDWGPKRTYDLWHHDQHYRIYMSIRNGNNSTTSIDGTARGQPLIDLDGICYGSMVNKTVYREQWAEMQTNNPDKVLLNSNLHLTQSLIGRSLYVFPLEWWYLNFKPEGEIGDSITFVCTEDLTKAETLNNLTAELGLPKYEGFDEVIAEGAYNVGGHRGYDKATSWEDLALEQENKKNSNPANDTGSSETDDSSANGYPLPDDLYQELKEFIDPFNERLFALVGKRCNW